MNRLALWATLVLLGMAAAVINLFTGWTVPVSPAAVVVGFGLFGGSAVLFVAMLIAVIRDRRWIAAHSSDASWVLARASQGLRWGSLFAIGFSFLLFANCSGSVTSGPSQLSGPMQDPTRFWELTGWVLAPMLVALLIPPMLASAAERLATSRPPAARRLGRLATWSVATVVGAVLLTVVIGLFVGINACLASPAHASAGYCAAGAGSLTNVLSLGALALFLPYLGLVNWALAQIEAGRPARGTGG